MRFCSMVGRTESQHTIQHLENEIHFQQGSQAGVTGEPSEERRKFPKSVILSGAKNPLQAGTISGLQGSFYPLLRPAFMACTGVNRSSPQGRWRLEYDRSSS